MRHRMSLRRKMTFIFETTTYGEDEDEPPIAENRRYRAVAHLERARGGNGSWGVFDIFENRFLDDVEVAKLTPQALMQEMPAYRQ